MVRDENIKFKWYEIKMTENKKVVKIRDEEIRCCENTYLSVDGYIEVKALVNIYTDNGVYNEHINIRLKNNNRKNEFKRRK